MVAPLSRIVDAPRSGRHWRALGTHSEDNWGSSSRSSNRSPRNPLLSRLPGGAGRSGWRRAGIGWRTPVRHGEELAVDKLTVLVLASCPASGQQPHATSQATTAPYSPASELPGERAPAAGVRRGAAARAGMAVRGGGVDEVLRRGQGGAVRRDGGGVMGDKRDSALWRRHHGHAKDYHRARPPYVPINKVESATPENINEVPFERPGGDQQSEETPIAASRTLQ